MMKPKKLHTDVWMGGILIVVSIVFYQMSKAFHNQSAAVWPRAVLIAIMILSSLLLVRGLHLSWQGASDFTFEAGSLIGPAVALALIVAYAVLMQFCGYFVSTAVFLPMGMYLLNQRSWKVILGVTVGLELFVYVLFVTQLQLRMP